MIPIKCSSVSSLIIDHHVLLFNLNLYKHALPRKQVFIHSYTNVDTNKFQSDIVSSNLIQNPADKLDELFDQYFSIFSSINDKHAPLKIRNVIIHPFTPWYNDNIKEAKNYEGSMNQIGETRD